MENETVRMARRHVIRGRRIVEQQRQRVRVLASHGRGTDYAEHTLHLFQRTLAIFEEHLRDLAKDSD